MEKFFYLLENGMSSENEESTKISSKGPRRDI
jgi:hypothetical protein